MLLLKEQGASCVEGGNRNVPVCLKIFFFYFVTELSPGDVL